MNCSFRGATPALALAMGLVLGSAGDAHAQTDVIHGCYVQRTGVIYRIDPSGGDLPGNLPTECAKADKHFQFAWNQQGPAGVSGYEIVTELTGSSSCGVVVECRSGTSFIVECPVGKVALSGGYRVEITEGILLEEYKVRESYPPAPNSWRIDLQNALLSTNTTAVVMGYAICATAS